MDAQSVADGALERARRAQALGAFLALPDAVSAPLAPAPGEQALHGRPIAVKDIIDADALRELTCRVDRRRARSERAAHQLARERRLGGHRLDADHAAHSPRRR
ncbi:hypothetical protein [Baekduia alba]|uniref:hypothetical protein n=1 Tax=Baekduia alba TaxID=2997333 RepID=UPI002340CA58|nr:hypothetical protein [Baekduia alba]